MPDKTPEELRKLIDNMQAGLVELFNQLHELRRRLNITEKNNEKAVGPSIVPIFAEVSKKDEQHDSTSSDTNRDYSVSDGDRITTVEQSEETDSLESSLETSELSSTPEAKIARVLDPILHELRTGESPAEVLAEYVQAAKDYLLPDPSTNQKVAHDMDLVLKFLRARGKKSIRSDERDNILKRISQWKKHLVRSII
jgi:hypothetical protein